MSTTVVRVEVHPKGVQLDGNAAKHFAQLFKQVHNNRKGRKS